MKILCKIDTALMGLIRAIFYHFLEDYRFYVFHLAIFIMSSIILNFFRPKKSYDDSYYRSLPDRIGFNGSKSALYYIISALYI